MTKQFIKVYSDKTAYKDMLIHGSPESLFFDEKKKKFYLIALQDVGNFSSLLFYFFVVTCLLL